VKLAIDILNRASEVFEVVEWWSYWSGGMEELLEYYFTIPLPLYPSTSLPQHLFTPSTNYLKKFSNN
jgi:hypothetical protein